MEEGGFLGFMKMHPELLLGFGVVAVLIVVAMVKKNGTTSTSGTQDLSGLTTNANGQPVVYVPTSTNFSTSNIGAQFANDPNLQSVSTGSIVTNSPLSVSETSSAPAPAPKPKSTAPVASAPAKPVVNNTSSGSTSVTTVSTSTSTTTTGGTTTGGVQPVKAPPAPAPVTKSIKWNYPYTIRSGDTLSAIANNVSQAARQAGAPSNTTITYQQIYNYNKTTIDNTANQHGNPVPGGPWNNIFPGEQIWLPTWS